MPEITVKATGQKILFRGLDDELKITSITVDVGALCWAWFEEAYQIETEDKFSTVVESIRGSLDAPDFFKQITVTFNPWSERHWLKRVFFDEETKRADTFSGTTTFRVNELDGTTKIVELYTDNKILKFEYDGDLTPIGETSSHAFGSVPITEYLNTDDGMGDYETELSLIDLYDAAQSDTANYMQDLSDAILAIIGRVSFPGYVDTAEKAIEYLRKMRKARLLNLEPPVDQDGREGSVDAKYLYKQYDVQGTEAYKNRIVSDIHKFTNTPDMTDSKFAGQQSGEALKWKVFGLDQERVDMQALFEQSLKRRYKLIARVSQLLKEIDDFDISKLKITFTPNLPKSLQEKIEAFKALGGELSQETAMAITDIVEDAKKEISLINSESKSRSQLAQKLEETSRLTDRELAHDHQKE